MAHLYRLIVAALLFAACNAQAFPLQSTFTWTFGSDTGQAADFESACQAGVNQVKSNQPNCTYYGQPCTWETVSEPENGMCYALRNGNTTYTVGISASNGCPPNSTQSGTSCTCNAGFNERRTGGITQCVKPEERTEEQLCEDMAALWNSTLNNDRSGRIGGKTLSETHMGITTCYDPGSGSGMPSGKGCKHKFTGDLGFTDDQGNKWVNGFSFAYDYRDKAEVGGSLSCNLADADPTKEAQPKDCRDGYKGNVNGVEVCIEAVTGDTEGIDWTRNTDGEGNQTDEKTNVKCKGDQCTVTTDKTTTKPDGTTTTTTTTTNANRQGYCARNPESSVCGRAEDDDGANKGARERGGGGSGGGDGDGDGEENPSQFGGACASGFTCEGDAILCAIAKDQHQRACKLFDDESPESKLYQDNKGKEGNQTGELPGNETISLTGRIDTSDALGGGGCFGDLSVTVWNTSVSLPLSNLCQYLAMLGNILVAVSMLMAARIVTRG